MRADPAVRLISGWWPFEDLARGVLERILWSHLTLVIPKSRFHSSRRFSRDIRKFPTPDGQKRRTPAPRQPLQLGFCVVFGTQDSAFSGGSEGLPDTPSIDVKSVEIWLMVDYT